MLTTTLVRPKVQHGPSRRHSWTTSLFGDILAFAVGLGSCYIFKLVGDIPLCEVILIPSLLLLVAIHPDRLHLIGRRLGVMFLLMGLWLLGQIVTDIFRSTVLHDAMRGEANIAFFMLDLAGIAILLKGNVRRQIIFTLGLSFGNMLAVKLDPSTYEGNVYKFGFTLPVIYLTVLASSYFYGRRQYAMVGLLFFGNTVVNVLLNLRTYILIMMVTAALILPVVPERVGRLRLLPRAGSTGRVFALAGIACVAGALAGLIATSLAASGALGQDAQWKNNQETTAGWGILIGGRPEILVSSRAVFDSPILGHGSWAKDPKYSEMLAEIEADYGMHPSEEGQKYEGVIPAHSHLMAAWVDAGILGAVFWGYVLISAVKSVVRATILRPPVAPFYVFVLTTFVWDILYSPFGSVRRVTESLFLVIICDLLDPDSAVRKTAGRLRRQNLTPTIQRRNMGKISAQWNGRPRF